MFSVPGLTTKSLKRRYDDSGLSDSENVDPLVNASPTKKRKNQVNQDIRKPVGSIHLTKPSRIKTPVKKASPFILPTPFDAPKSAPIRGAAAGRLPKSNAFKPFARGSLGIGTSYKVRPSSLVSRHAPRTALSISEHFSKTAPRSKIKLGPVASVPSKKSWNFEIYVDTEQEEMANLMEHSTSTLDISDDEGGVSPKDDRGKENIPPEELSDSISSAQLSINPSRLIQMPDELREPLGELNPADFVPEGIDASDVVLVLEDRPEAGKKARSPLSITETSAIDEAAQATQQPELFASETISNIINNSARSSGHSAPQNTASATGDFEIWESGSSTEDSAPTDC